MSEHFVPGPTRVPCKSCGGDDLYFADGTMEFVHHSDCPDKPVCQCGGVGCENCDRCEGEGCCHGCQLELETLEILKNDLIEYLESLGGNAEGFHAFRESLYAAEQEPGQGDTQPDA